MQKEDWGGPWAVGVGLGGRKKRILGVHWGKWGEVARKNAGHQIKIRFQINKK